MFIIVGRLRFSAEKKNPVSDPNANEERHSTHQNNSRSIYNFKCEIISNVMQKRFRCCANCIFTFFNLKKLTFHTPASRHCRRIAWLKCLVFCCLRSLLASKFTSARMLKLVLDAKSLAYLIAAQNRS